MIFVGLALLIPFLLVPQILQVSLNLLQKLGEEANFVHGPLLVTNGTNNTNSCNTTNNTNIINIIKSKSKAKP